MTQCGHEGVDELVVLVVAEPTVPPPEVQRIREQCLVLGARIEEHRQGALRVDTTDCGVEGELADGDAHAAEAEVAEPEDPFAVGHHHDVDIFGNPVGRQRVVEQLRNAVTVRPRHVQTVLAAIGPRPLLTCQAHGRGVHDRQQLFEVVDKEPVEQHRVVRLQGPQEDVASKVAVRRIELGPHPLELRLEVFDHGRQQSVELIAVALFSH